MSGMSPEENVRRLSALRALRKVLCRRLREHGMVPDQVGGMGCDGTTMVCGFCDNTAYQMLIELIEEDRMRDRRS